MVSLLPFFISSSRFLAVLFFPFLNPLVFPFTPLSSPTGKSGPLFHFDVHDDIRLTIDTRVEKDESHAGKIVTRAWYERNKHIFPASRWEVVRFVFCIPFAVSLAYVLCASILSIPFEHQPASHTHLHPYSTTRLKRLTSIPSSRLKQERKDTPTPLSP